MFLAHFTGSGLSEIENLFADSFENYLESAYKLYKLEQENPKQVILLGMKDS